jgi:hypothetical protein
VREHLHRNRWINTATRSSARICWNLLVICTRYRMSKVLHFRFETASLRKWGEKRIMSEMLFAVAILQGFSCLLAESQVQLE